jgi:hypothetical protein
MNTRTNIRVVVGTALLAFLGALLGTFLSGYMQESLWKKKTTYEERRLILNERIKLIDRFSKIINMRPKVRTLQEFTELQADIAKLNASCIKKGKTGGLDKKECFPQENIIEVMKLTNERAELNAEFASTMQLVVVHFGPKTLKAAESYSKIGAWWEADPIYSRTLLSGIIRE